MAQDFSEFITKLNKEPIEKQLTKLKQLVGSLSNFLERLITYYDDELGKIHYKIISLEAKDLIVNLPKPKIPPLPPPIVREKIKSVKSAIRKELKELFKEENGLDEE